MAATKNERIVRRLVEDSVNANRPDALDTVVDMDVRIHPGTPGAAPETRGIEELRAFLGQAVPASAHGLTAKVLKTYDRMADCPAAALWALLEVVYRRAAADQSGRVAAVPGGWAQPRRCLKQ